MRVSDMHGFDDIDQALVADDQTLIGLGQALVSDNQDLIGLEQLPSYVIGRVTDEAGRPVPGVRFDALDLVLNQRVASGMTREDGSVALALPVSTTVKLVPSKGNIGFSPSYAVVTSSSTPSMTPFFMMSER